MKEDLSYAEEKLEDMGKMGLGKMKRLAEYKRKGGLYVAKMKVRRRVQPGSAKDSPFGGQGNKR